MINQHTRAGYYGQFGGQFIPEILRPAIVELDEAYLELKNSNEFQNELNWNLTNYAGRPTPLYFAENLTDHYRRAKIYLKREVIISLFPAGIACYCLTPHSIERKRL